MKIPNDRQYNKTHEWVQWLDDRTVRVGLSDFAQQSLGGLVFASLPEKGDLARAGEAFGEVESVKAVSDINAPVSGNVSAVNGEVLDAPERINADPYGAWLIEISDVDESEELLDAAQYEAHCAAGQ